MMASVASEGASMTLTARENLKLVLAGREPAWVPFALNFAQWFKHHAHFGTLPAELSGCGDYIGAMKALDCDIFTRNVDGGVRVRDTRAQPRREVEQAATGPRTTVSYDTPYGTLARVDQAQTAMTASHHERYLVEDWQRDGDAFRWLLDQQQYDWDEQAFMRTDKRIGDDGILNVACGCSPLKMLHHNLGLDHTCLFVLDEPDAAGELCDLFWSKLRPVLLRLARHEQVESVILMDNIDVPFYPPALVERYWVPYVRDAAEIMRAFNKPLFVHACGKLRGLSAQYARTGVSGLEGISHPPLGDWPAAEAQRCHDRFIFIGGFGAHEQQEPDDARVCAFYEQYLAGTSRQRFIFSSSCQTAVQTPWQRMLLVRDICRAWGGPRNPRNPRNSRNSRNSRTRNPRTPEGRRPAGPPQGVVHHERT
jgi:hypothetical protein